jgi:hypothetical protein
MRNLESAPNACSVSTLNGKGNPLKIGILNFESPDSAISRFPMTLMKSMVSLHQGKKVFCVTNSNFFDILNKKN